MKRAEVNIKNKRNNKFSEVLKFKFTLLSLTYDRKSLIVIVITTQEIGIYLPNNMLK